MWKSELTSEPSTKDSWIKIRDFYVNLRKETVNIMWKSLILIQLAIVDGSDVSSEFHIHLHFAWYKAIE